MSRAVWFVAGAGAGVYAVAKARRVAEALTPEGLADRLSGLAVGLHLFGEEVRAGREEKETDLRERLGLALHGDHVSGQHVLPETQQPTPRELTTRGND